MHCKKCDGRVFIDRCFSSSTHVELFCSMCGKRWFVKKESSGLGKWLSQKEKGLLRRSGIFT